MDRPSATGSPAASDALPARGTTAVRSVRSQAFWLALLLLGIVGGIAVRLSLLPSEGLRVDVDLFARWIHGIAVNPLGRAFDLGIGFPPVMIYIWAALTAVEPAFRTVMDASDPWIRIVMKSPAALADLGLAISLWAGLRERIGLATLAALAVFLHPAIFGISSGWGQLESLYVLPALLGLLLAVRGHWSLSAIAVGLAVMTKPQALPLLVPFLAWYLATGGLRGVSRWLLVLGLTSAVLWLPFLADDGPAQYLRNVAAKQNGEFGVLSLDAWNIWWLVQRLIGAGNFVSDQVSIIGPITPRIIGFVTAGVLSLIVGFCVYRTPTQRTLALGLAAVSLITFCFLTTMHERYAYGTLVFLALVLYERRLLLFWITFGIVFSLNVFVAIPPSDLLYLAVLGSFAMIALTVSLVGILIETVRPTDVASSLLSPRIANRVRPAGTLDDHAAT